MELSGLTLGVGALSTLVSTAVGYGVLRNSVNTLKESLLKLESEAVSRDRQIRHLELWKAELKGRHDAKRYKT